MRRLYTSLVAVAATLVPVLALAENPNQQMAEQIAAHLRQSGQLSHYSIAVKFKDGTAWLQGQVRDLRQENIALNLALEPDGVQRVINNLSIGPVALPAPVPTPLPIPVRQASSSEPTADVKQAGEEVTPQGSPQQQEPEQAPPKESVTRTPAQPPKPMFAFLDMFRRPAATPSDSLPAEEPVALPAPLAAPVKQAFDAERAADATPAGEEAAPQEKSQQKESVPRMPSPLPKPMYANSASRSEALPVVDPAGDTQADARRVPASFASAPAQRVAATETVTEPAPQPVPTAAPRPMPMAMVQTTTAPRMGVPGGPMPMATPGVGGAVAPTRFDAPNMPNYAWPSYASHPNYAAVTYPRQYSATAWPYIGPFYPYPQVPLGWRKVTLQWDDGWWMLDFKDEPGCCWWR